MVLELGLSVILFVTLTALEMSGSKMAALVVHAVALRQEPLAAELADVVPDVSVGLDVNCNVAQLLEKLVAGYQAIVSSYLLFADVPVEGLQKSPGVT